MGSVSIAEEIRGRIPSLGRLDPDPLIEPVRSRAPRLLAQENVETFQDAAQEQHRSQMLESQHARQTLRTHMI